MRTIVILRHAQANPNFISLSHHRFPISEEGRRQATHRRDSLPDNVFDVVLTSHLLRAVETAEIIASNSIGAMMTKLPELFYDEQSPIGRAIDDAFAQLGHASLREFNKIVPEEMARWGVSARDAILESIDLLAPKVERVLIVGHGTLLPSLLAAFVHDEEPFLDRVLEEAAGYEVTIHDDGRTTWKSIE